MDDEIEHGPSRRDLMRGAAGVAALTGFAGAARAQSGGDATAAADGDAPGAIARELGNGLTPPGDPIPDRLTGRPFPARFTPPEPPTRRLGWAVAGLGDFAINYQIPALDDAKHSKLAGLVSGNVEKANAVADARGIDRAHVYSYDNFDSIADDDAVDVVYVITPNGLHEDLVLRALRAGKHVLCEKPMANTVAACERMVDAAREAGRKLMIAYRAHFEPHNLEAKRRLDAGEFGAVNYYEAATHRPLDVSRPRDQWRIRYELSGGGSMPDIGIYALNGVIFFAGEAPVALTAQVQSPPDDPRFGEVEDVCVAQLRFPSGAVANISSSYTTVLNRIALCGDQALATLSPATSYYDNRLTVSTWDGTERQVGVSEQSDVQFHREMDHLSEAIKNDTDVRTPGEMGLRDVRLIEAIYEAARRGTWVELDDEQRVVERR